MKINIIGQMFGNTGYASHTRGLVEGIVKCIGEDNVSIESPRPEMLPPLTPVNVVKMLDQNFEQEINISILQPPFAKLKLVNRPKAFYQYCIFEGDRIPAFWAEALNDPQITGILVPSLQLKEVCEMSGVKRPIHIIPHGHNPEVFQQLMDISPEMEPLREDRSKVFTFGWNKGWSQGERDRSGLEIALRAFTEEFEKDDKVRLLVHINPSYMGGNPQDIMNKVNADVEALKLKPVEERAKVIMNMDNLPEAKIPELYACMDVFISTSKGDAFDIPVIEAMACGLPVIVGRHHPLADIATRTVASSRTPSTESNPMYEGINWWTCNQTELQKQMRNCYEQRFRQGTINEKVQEIAKDYTWENSAKKLIEVVKNE